MTKSDSCDRSFWWRTSILRRKQDIWEHPRNIAILVGATAALTSAIAGFIGFKIAQTPGPPPVIINLPAAK